MIDQLRLIDAYLLGVVLNRVPHASAFYYGSHDYFKPNEKLEKRIAKVKAG